MLHNMAMPSRYSVLPPMGVQSAGTRNPMSLLPPPTMGSFGPPSSLQMYLHNLAQRENMIRNAFADYLKPVCSQEGEIMLDVECGENRGLLYLSRFCQGSKGPCIRFEDMWLTPNEFQYISGRESAKDWKRSIRHQGKSLKLLLAKGILTVHPSSCSCTGCRISSPVNRGKLSGYAPRFDDVGQDFGDVADDRRVNSDRIQEEFPRKLAEFGRSPSNPPHSDALRRTSASPEQKMKKETPVVKNDGQNIFTSTKSSPNSNVGDWYFDRPLMQHLPGLKDRSPAAIHDASAEPLSFLRNLARDSMAVKSDGITQNLHFPFYKPVPQMHPGVINTGNLDLMNSFLRSSRTLFPSTSVSQASAFYQLPPFSTVLVAAPSGASSSSDTSGLGGSPKEVYKHSPSPVSSLKTSDSPLDLSGSVGERNDGVSRSRKPKNPPPVRVTEGVFGKRRRLEEDAYGRPPSITNTDDSSFCPKKLRHLYQKEAYSPLHSGSNSPLNFQTTHNHAEAQRRPMDDSESHTSEDVLERSRSV